VIGDFHRRDVKSIAVAISVSKRRYHARRNVAHAASGAGQPPIRSAAVIVRAVTGYRPEPGDYHCVALV